MTKILLLLFVFSFIFRIDLSFNQDLGRHIKLGEIITKSLSVPKTNLFAYTNADFPFVNTHWLFGVIAYFFSQTIGLHALLFLKILIFLASVWLIIKVIPKENEVLLLPLGFIFLHVLRERLELRPEIFSFLFTTLTLFILNRFLTQKTKLIFFLPLISMLWINLHIYFFVGITLQAIFLLQLIYKFLRTHQEKDKLKLLGIIFTLSIFASLLNPNGLAGLLYPLNVNQNYGYTIAENQTMSLLENIHFRNSNFLFVKLSLGLIAFSLLFTLLKRRFELKNILIPVFGASLALLNVRSFPYLVFLSLPFTLINIGIVKKNTWTILFSFIFGMLLILESFFYLNGEYYKINDQPYKVGFGFEENVKGAMDFVIKNNLEKPIYNNFDIGSYIIYRGYPNYQVFVDGRPEGYPKEFFQQVYIPSQSDYMKFKELESKYQFKTIIFSHTDQTPWAKSFLPNLVKDKGWELVYIDDFMLVYIKKDLANQKNISKTDLGSIKPSQFNFDNHLAYLRIGVFLGTTNHLESAGPFVVKSLQVSPKSTVANQMLGNFVINNFFW